MSTPCTLVELMDRLEKLEETYLLELLGVDSKMLLERFGDIVEADPERFESELEEDEEDE